MELVSYLKEFLTFKPFIIITWNVMGASLIIAGYVWKVKPLLRRIADALEDWFGEHPRPGIVPRPGAMLRVATLEEEVKALHAHRKAAIEEIAALRKMIDTPVLVPTPRSPLVTGETYAVTKLPKESPAHAESVIRDPGSSVISGSIVDSESLLRTSSIPRVSVSGH